MKEVRAGGVSNSSQDDLSAPTQAPTRYTNMYCWLRPSKLACHEVIEHLEARRWLVHWHHVARIEDAQESEALCTPDFAGVHSLALFVGRLPFEIWGIVERGFAWPVHLEGPRFVAQPVADEILVSGVDENANPIAEHIGQLLLIVLHPVTAEHHVDFHVAVCPLGVCLVNAEVREHLRASKIFADVAEVVAETRHVTFNAHVIDVHAAELERCDLSHVATRLSSQADRVRHRGVCMVARADGRKAGGHCQLHRGVRHGANSRLVMVGGNRHLGIVTILHFGVREPVANADTLEIKRKALRALIALPHAVCDGWNVMPGVRFAEDEEGVFCELRMRPEELL
mmetsp:Transcript_3707/g.9359  ORF Transcript_3707/g.9359 Transcript_3707/m.9359 type:complete len:341 (+) Transcript_3707:215-1237(+)